MFFKKRRAEELYELRFYNKKQHNKVQALIMGLIDDAVELPFDRADWQQSVVVHSRSTQFPHGQTEITIIHGDEYNTLVLQLLYNRSTHKIFKRHIKKAIRKLR